MIKRLKEKFHKKTFVKHICLAFVSVLLFVAYALFMDKYEASLRGKIIFGASVYIVTLIAVSVLWSMIEQRIAKKRGVEIEPILGNMTLDIMPRLYMPVIISDMTGKIIWFNKAFCNLSGSKNIFRQIYRPDLQKHRTGYTHGRRRQRGNRHHRFRQLFQGQRLRRSHADKKLLHFRVEQPK